MTTRVPSTRAINFEPYLQNVSQTSVTICFFTNASETGTVYYSTDLSFSSSATDTISSTFHEIQITSLSPGTKYNYYAKTPTEQSNNSFFKTASTGWEAFRFAAIGDTRTNHAEHEKLMGLLDGYDPEFCLNAGDQVETGSSSTDWNNFFKIVAKYSNNSCYWPSIGNHDLVGDSGANYLKFFSLPNNERWYSFDHKNAHFVILDTYSAYANGSAQNNWLRADLAAADGWAEWIFVNFHNPPYSSGSSHGSDLTVRNTLNPIFMQYNVSVVFTGHDHIYEHADPGNGIQYFVTGGGGAPLASVGTSWFTVKSASIYQFMTIDVNDNITTLKCIKDDNTVFETIVLSHPDTRAPAIVPLTATDTGIGGEVFLNWSGYDEAGQGAFSYNLFYSSSNFSDVSAMSPNNTYSAGNFTTSIRGLTNGTKYYFAVTAKDGSGNNLTAVDTVWAIPSDITPPAMPSGLAVVDVTNNSINLTWNANTEPDLAGYRIYMNASGSGVGGPMGIISTLGLVTGLNVTNLTQNTTYAFALDAIDEATPTQNNSTRTANVNGKTDTVVVPAPVNHPPQVVANISEIIMDEDPTLPTYINLSSLFFDPDSDLLTFGYSDVPQLTINRSANDTSLQLMPEKDWNGATWIIIYAEDSQFNVSANISVVVNPVNDPPVLNFYVDGNINSCYNSTYCLNSPHGSYEDGTIGFGVVATDIDGPQILNATIQYIGKTEKIYLQTIYQEDNHTLNGYVPYTFDNTDIGKTSWNISITDGVAVSFRIFNLSVGNVNDPPQILNITTPLEDDVYEYNQSIEFKANVFDEDLVFGDVLTFNWSSNVSGLILQTQNGSLILPPGDHRITFMVTDTNGTYDTRSVNVTVLPRPIKTYIIVITTPSEDAHFAQGQQFTVSGTSENFSWGTSVEVTLSGITNTTHIGIDGKWSINMKAPLNSGSYILTAGAGNVSDNITIQVSQEAKTKEDNTGGTIFSNGLFIAGIITLAIILIIIFVLVFVVMAKRRRDQEKIAATPAPENTQQEPAEEPQESATGVAEHVHEEAPEGTTAEATVPSQADNLAPAAPPKEEPVTPETGLPTVDGVPKQEDIAGEQKDLLGADGSTPNAETTPQKELKDTTK